MIELEQIKKTDPIKSLRGQLNTAFNEIVTDQPFVGQVINPSIDLFAVDSLGKPTQVGAIRAGTLSKYPLYALCFPESNGVYIATLYGCFNGMAISVETTSEPHMAVIDIPTIKLPTREGNISTFVPASHFGFTQYAPVINGTRIEAFAGTPTDFNFSLISSSGDPYIVSVGSASIVIDDNSCNVCVPILVTPK